MIRVVGIVLILGFISILSLAGWIWSKLNHFTNDLSQGIVNSQGRTLVLDKKLFTPIKLFTSTKIKEIKNYSRIGFEEYNFLGLNFSLPIKNPVYYAIPNFSPEIKREHFSFLILNPRDEKVGKLTYLGFYNLENLLKHPIMFFPLFEQAYLIYPYEKRIRNLFTMDIKNDSNGYRGISKKVITIVDRKLNFQSDLVSFGRVGRKLKNTYYYQVESLDKNFKHYYIVKEFAGRSYLFHIEYSVLEEKYENLVFNIIESIRSESPNKNRHLEYYQRFKKAKANQGFVSELSLNLYASLINRMRQNEEMYMRDFNEIYRKGKVGKAILEKFYLYNLLNFNQSFATDTNIELFNDRLNLYIKDEVSSKKASFNIIDDELEIIPERDLEKEHMESLKNKKMKREKSKVFID